MATSKDPVVEALEQGRSAIIEEPEGGSLASMRTALKHGQTLILSPIGDLGEIKPGDIVLVKWHKDNTILHLVKEVDGDKFLIVNSMGKINGWVNGKDILGRVSQIIDPPPIPSVLEMLSQLEYEYRKLLESQKASECEAQRLLSVVWDMRRYADRIGSEAWEKEDSRNSWSFKQRLWHLLRQAQKATKESQDISVEYVTDYGKKIVGLVADATLFHRK